MKRRDFLRLAALTAGGALAGQWVAGCQTATAPAEALGFPAGFLWGSATSSYQVEGAVQEDGRGESIWDRFCRVPGKVSGGHTGDIACDHYHRWQEDLDLVASLGLGAYRFSIAWPRIMPDGKGPVNQKGLDFYKRLVEGLHQRNICPNTTLYHWDLPQALQEKGGWLNPDTAKRFGEYAAVLFQALGTQVPAWCTINEPAVVAYVGHLWGSHAPGMTSWKDALRASHTVMLAHGEGVRAFRAAGLKESGIGIVLNCWPMYPASDTEADRLAAWRQDGFQNRWYLDAVLRGGYPEDMVAYYRQNYDPMDYMTAPDAGLIGERIDWLGLNYYHPQWIRAQPGSPFLGGGPEKARHA
ncbi:MAG TPA: family 1 glycosylhydrolase, partial [Symbiobacteriaceae bacterium]|nr:family 1 glycosylhydrolase [Symbiobacteriaceae bacterium]